MCMISALHCLFFFASALLLGAARDKQQSACDGVSAMVCSGLLFMAAIARSATCRIACGHPLRHHDDDTCLCRNTTGGQPFPTRRYFG